MKILAPLRKPYLAMLLLGLVLFISCNPNDNVSLEEPIAIDASILKI
tara:strand:- start:71 stop:211 length:141 start_codon:yes stop_codon:yes gene_type:complete